MIILQILTKNLLNTKQLFKLFTENSIIHTPKYKFYIWDFYY